MRSLLGKLASPAERLDLYRTAQQCELSQAGSTLKKLVHFGYLDVMYPSASDAQDVMMRLDVAVIARNIVQQRYLACFPHFAKLIENPMDRGQRYVGMPAPYRRTDLIGARMILRGEEGLYDCEPLGGDGNPARTAPRYELAESLN
jgi:hypothetical protein